MWLHASELHVRVPLAAPPVESPRTEIKQRLTPNPDATPAPGREFTFLEQLIGNFGKFNSAGSGGNTPGGPNTGGP